MTLRGGPRGAQEAAEQVGVAGGHPSGLGGGRRLRVQPQQVDTVLWLPGLLGCSWGVRLEDPVLPLRPRLRARPVLLGRVPALGGQRGRVLVRWLALPHVLGRGVRRLLGKAAVWARLRGLLLWKDSGSLTGGSHRGRDGGPGAEVWGGAEQRTGPCGRAATARAQGGPRAYPASPACAGSGCCQRRCSEATQTPGAPRPKTPPRRHTGRWSPAAGGSSGFPARRGRHQAPAAVARVRTAGAPRVNRPQHGLRHMYAHRPTCLHATAHTRALFRGAELSSRETCHTPKTSTPRKLPWPHRAPRP